MDQNTLYDIITVKYVLKNNPSNTYKKYDEIPQSKSRF